MTGCDTLTHSTEQHKAFDLYLLVGQSNMAGRGVIEPQDKETHSSVFSFNSNDKWELAREPIHYDKANRGVGPGLSFGKYLASVLPNTKIGLIPAAVGGTKISYWKPGNERGLYEEAIRKVKLAMKTGRLKGIIWQQGESDSNSKDAHLYERRLIELMECFRKDLGDEKLPIVIGGLGDFLKSSHYKEVNQSMKKAVRVLGNAQYSEASKFGHIGDSLHFNSESQREIGIKMAQKMIELIH